MPQFIGSTTPLSGAASFTSAWVPTNTWASVGGTVFADQTGTLNIEQSGDGIHADALDSVAVTASTPTKFSIALVGSYVRLRYVNGATPQGTFRLYPRFVLGNGT